MWAGVVEAFISQYHQPVLPYSIKIAMGWAELAVLIAWLGLGGRDTPYTNQSADKEKV